MRGTAWMASMSGGGCLGGAGHPLVARAPGAARMEGDSATHVHDVL